MTSIQPDNQLAELALEATIGSKGTENSQREIRLINFSDFGTRKHEIADQLWQAATEVGFFQLDQHEIDMADIEHAFAMAQSFFDLPSEHKQKYPLRQGMNAGWEYMEQVRPSTGTADQKESYQITLPRMQGLWPDDHVLEDFKSTMLRFERQCWETGMKVLSCFAMKLGFAEDFFTRAHDPSVPEYQSTLRLLHYFATGIIDECDGELWRAGAHTDFDCLTMVFQRPGQGGLQLCPGKESGSMEWTSVEAWAGVITCNIGDMLMRWSDDKLKSTLHRVKMPEADEYRGARYSMAFFCQANTDVVIQGPEKKYAAITAADYLRQRIAANFAVR